MSDELKVIAGVIALIMAFTASICTIVVLEASYKLKCLEKHPAEVCSEVFS